MHPRVVVEFGMEGSDQLVALASRHNVSVHFGKHLACARHIIYIWGADESHRNVRTDLLHRVYCEETAELAAIGIAANIDVHRAEVHGGEEDESSACAEDGQTISDSLADWLKQPEVVEEFALRGRFSARDYQSVLMLVPVVQLAHQKCLCA